MSVNHSWELNIWKRTKKKHFYGKKIEPRKKNKKKTIEIWELNKNKVKDFKMKKKNEFFSHLPKPQKVQKWVWIAL